MARRIDFHSAPIVGKRRNMTESGIVTCCGIWIFSMAEMNSLTDVVAITYSPIMMVTTKRVRIPPQNSAK